MKVHPGVVAFAATLTTIAGGVAAVWLADDVRAFGLAIVVAGTAASAIALRFEQPHGQVDAHSASVNSPRSQSSVEPAHEVTFDKVA